MAVRPGTRVGPYEVIALIGAGGMGEVYRARDTRLGRDVAIKVLPAEFAADPERLRRFEQEARTVAALDHPNILAIHDVGTHESAPYIVTELLEGESLRDRLSGGAMPVRKAVELAVQIAQGLAAAHEKGVVHRDLKPGNVFLTKDGVVKILDFGIAKLAPPRSAEEKAKATTVLEATDAGTVLGTVGYMSPEQVLGKPLDARSDLFSLGVVLYEMLSGARPFQKDSAPETMAAILNEEPPDLAEIGKSIPPSLARIVRHCLEKELLSRFQSARDVVFALESVGGDTSGTAFVGATEGALTRARPGFRYAAAFLAGALVFAAIGSTFFRRLHLADPSRVTYTRLTVQRGWIGHARFSPDGKTVFYSAAWDGRPTEVFEVRPGFLNSRSVGLSATLLQSVSRSGMMAVLIRPDSSRVGWTLAEVPITGGVPRPILDDIGGADWLPDGKTLAVAQRVQGTVRLEMPPGRVLYETAGALSHIRISRDGRRVAFIENPRSGDLGRVVITDKMGRVLARSTEWRFIGGAAWSADGREFWFCPTRDVASSDLMAMTPDGRQRVVARFLGLTWLMDIAQNGQVLLMRRSLPYGIRGRGSRENEERELGWFDSPMAADISDDGRLLLFDEEGAYGGPHFAVCMRGTDGSPPVRLGEGEACALSPDGKWALAIHNGPPQRLILLPTGVGDSTSLPRGTIDSYFSADWLPDGKSIVFAASEAGQARRTFVQDLKGGMPHAITPEGIAGSKVSPDGRFVAAVSQDQRLHVCPTDGDSATFVAELLAGEVPINWASDGRGLYVGRIGGTSTTVYRIELATGERVLWRTLSVPDPAGIRIWRVILTPDGRSYAYSYNRAQDDLYLVEGLK